MIVPPVVVRKSKGVNQFGGGHGIARTYFSLVHDRHMLHCSTGLIQPDIGASSSPCDLGRRRGVQERSRLAPCVLA